MPAEHNKNRTKRDLDNALRQLLAQKSLNQIRVRELTELCDIRRQSFYYHFPDVYALFAWSLEEEKNRLLERQKNCLTWQQALRDLLEHTRENRRYYKVLLENQGRAGLREVLEAALGQMLEQTLEYYQRRCGAKIDMGQTGYWEILLLTLLESGIQEELTQPPKDIVAALEAAVRQGAAGVAWQNLAMERNK